MDNIQRPIRDPILKSDITHATDPRSHAFDGDFDGDGEGPLTSALRNAAKYGARSVADLKLSDDKQQTDKSRDIDF